MRAWVLVLLLPLAGCLDEPADPLAVVTPQVIDAPGFYAVGHDGGPLELVSDQDAGVTVYGPDDERIGHARLRPGQPTAAFPLVPAGDVVLHVERLNGTLAVTASEVRPLVAHMERVVLVDRAPRDSLLPLAIDPEPVRTTVDVALARAPELLALRAGGGHEGLHVVVRGSGGLAMEAAPRPAAGGSSLTGHALAPVPAAFFPANIHDGAFDVRVEADHLDGVLLLEAWSYSRAPPAYAAATDVEPTEMAFDHGSTEGRPVRVTLHPKATAIGLQNEDTRNASVAVFGPNDERLGVVRIPPGKTVAVPAAGGDHVVAPLSGDVRVLVDRVPQDFELHPLETVSETYPRTVVGGGGRYEQREEPVDVAGVVFQALPAEVSASQALSCNTGATTRLTAGNETIAVSGAGAVVAPYEAAARLANAMQVVVDGIGPDCEGPAVRLVAYVR